MILETTSKSRTTRSEYLFPEDANRARSATEAFLYRRLESLPETAGRFRLNVELPTAFDEWGRMEVALLCADARVVVELDGAQHLDNADAYRCDRCNDFCCRRTVTSYCDSLPRT